MESSSNFLTKSDANDAEDFYQIENFYELNFHKHLKNAQKISPNDSNLARLSSQLLISFKNLTNAYIRNNNWSKFFSLIDQIESNLFQKSNQTKLRKLQQDEIYRFLADVFYKLGYSMNALDFYRRSIQISEQTNLLAIESFENLLNLNIERWHYRMLNDRVRNGAYSQAIRKCLRDYEQNPVRNAPRILDIGSGTGLLSAICLNHKMDFDLNSFKLFACEQSELFYKVCSKYLNSFNMNRYIKVFNKHSSDLKANEDLSSPIDLVVTEIFDDGLLGEGCLNTFYDIIFKQNLLDLRNKKSKIIPESASVYIAPIESAFLRKSNYFRKKFGSVQMSAKCTDNSLKFEKFFDSESSIYEPYTTENMNQIDFGFLSEPIPISEFSMRFGDRALLEKFCARNESVEVTKKFEFKQKGTLDAYLLWFVLNLDSEISITNSPLANKFLKPRTEISQCWQHAIYNLSSNFQIKSGQSLDLRLKMRNDCFLAFPDQTIENETNQTPTENETINLDLNRIEIGLLNNSAYQSFYLNWFENEVLRNCSANSLLKIGLLTNTFSILFFKIIFEYAQLLEKEKQSKIKLELFINSSDDSASSNDQKSSFKHLIETLFKSTECLSVNYLSNELVFEAREANNFSNMLDLDYLIYEPVDYRFGILRKNLLSDLMFIKSNNKNKDLKLFPGNIHLKGMLVESSSLLGECELVSDENLCISNLGKLQCLSLREILSDYRTRHQYSLNLSNNLKNSAKFLTDVETIMILDLDKSSHNSDEPKAAMFRLKESGRIDACLYWYELINENSDFFMHIDYDSSQSNDEDDRKLKTFKKHVYSPYANSFHESNSSNQLAAVCFYSKGDDQTQSNQIDMQKYRGVRVNYLFKNDIFHAKDFEWMI